MRICRSAPLLAVLALLADVPQSAIAGGAQASDSPTKVGGLHLRLGFDGNDGHLRSLFDPLANHEHLTDGAAGPRLWTFRAGDGAKEVLISPREAKFFLSEPLGDGPMRARLVWRGFAVPAAPDMEVEVRVRLELAEPTSRWEWTVRNPGSLTVREVRFPILSSISPQENEFLAVPHWMGERAADPRRLLISPEGKGRRLEWHYPGELSMQCLAYYRQDGPGFYVACDDTEARRKSFALWGDAKAQIHFEMVHQLEQEPSPRQCRTLGYQVVLGVFRGDWFTAAERYRGWALQQPWAQQSRLRSGQVPEWVRQTGIWVWNRGRSPQVLPPASGLQEKLGLPVSVFWHWWHGCPYDAGFPEYLPPREGTEPFRNALAEAHRRDLHALVYMNQRLWGMTTKSWTSENAAASAVKGPDGSIRPEVYNTFTRQPCASMCLGTAFWREKYAGLAEEAVRGLGVDGIYMDQACSSLPCYDRGHGHPLGGGTYWTDGFRKLAGDIRRRCGNARPVALAGEGCGEAWLPYLDLMLTLQVSRERYAAIQDGWEPIPFFHAVYHPYAILYGNYSSLTVPPYDDLWPAEHAPRPPLALLDRKFSRQFYLEQARAFVWGQQPTIANFLPSQIRDRAEEIDYALRLARTRHRAAKYLLHGTFLRPPAVDAPETATDFSRLSIYAGQGERVRGFRKTCPVVLAAAWRAPDGDLGIALASTVDSPTPVSLKLDAQEHQLPYSGRIDRFDEAGRTTIGRFSRASPTIQLIVPARTAWVLEMPASHW